MGALHPLEPVACADRLTRGPTASRKAPCMDRTLTTVDTELLRKDFTANPGYRLAQNAVTRVGVDEVAINREIVNSTSHAMSTLLDDWKVTNQQRSGRCWLFAGL